MNIEDDKKRDLQTLRCSVKKLNLNPEDEKNIVNCKSLPKDLFSKVISIYKLKDNRSDFALTVLIIKNKGLVHDIAKSFAWSNVPIEDLMQEGSLGVIKAVERFEVDRGNSFSTYAAWRIRHGIKRYIYKTSGFLYLPVHVHERRFKTSEKMRLGKHNEISEKEMKYYEATNFKDFSLDDNPIDVDSEYHNIQKDELAISSSVLVMARERKKEFEEIIEIVPDVIIRRNTPRQEALTEKHVKIFYMRYGFGEYEEPMYLSEIAEEFGITHQGICHICKSVIKKLTKAGVFENNRDFSQFDTMLENYSLLCEYCHE